MYSGTRSCMIIGFTLLVCLGPGINSSEAQQIRIEGVFPRQLPRGQATVINVAVPNRDAIQAPGISPPAGGGGSGIQPGRNFPGGLTWCELTLDVAKDAGPGDRTLPGLLPTGSPG